MPPIDAYLPSLVLMDGDDDRSLPKYGERGKIPVATYENPAGNGLLDTIQLYKNNVGNGVIGHVYVTTKQMGGITMPLVGAGADAIEDADKARGFFERVVKNRHFFLSSLDYNFKPEAKEGCRYEGANTYRYVIKADSPETVVDVLKSVPELVIDSAKLSRVSLGQGRV